ncbi:MAG: SsrA-binding protein [Chloroflexi bacterium]|jgi:SsrA-binding protein|nr:MAG: SsrA-binding protein [Chloroflexota bacterium]
MPEYKTIVSNRKAFHDYEILDKVEAGLVLTGSEIKSIRAGRVNLGDAFAKPERGELWLMNMHISPYPQAGIYNHEPYRPRKLLLHRSQVEDLAAQASQKGLTLVPLRLYIKDHHAKMEIGIARGRRQYDKRNVVAKREADRDMRRALQHAARGR